MRQGRTPSKRVTQNKNISKKRIRELKTESGNESPILLKKSRSDTSASERKQTGTEDNGILIKLSPRKEDIDWNQWVAATLTRNYLLEDGILDLLQIQGSALTKTKVDYQDKFIKIIGSNPDNFIAAIMEQGIKFEKKVVQHLINKLGRKNVINIGGDTNPRSEAKYLETLQAMKDGYKVIYQGIVRNYRNKTYGIPDLLIRSDILEEIFELTPVVPDIVHYVVVDIKCKTLHLAADGIHLRNDGPIKAYKAQLCVYNQALGLMQGYTPNTAFILGWKWKYTQQRCGIIKEYHGDNCFERLGHINYSNYDKTFIERTEKAVEWIRDVRQNAHTWDLTKLPLPREELYPNMCNPHDYPYGKIKRAFAEDIEEISLMWKCGTKHRKAAHAKGIYSWKDPRITPELLGIGGDFTSGVVHRILEVHHSPQNILPKVIQNNFGNWKQPQKYEFFVDFEMTCSVFSDFDDITNDGTPSLIFMIGVGYVKEGKWKYRSFTVDRLDTESEMAICRQFVEYMHKVSNGMWNNIYHWSPAEASAWNRAFVRDGNWCYLNWVDMLKIFHTEPIGVKGCLNFGLKNIAKAFHKFGYIQSTWDEGGSCVDGADAAVGAYKVDRETRRNGTLFKNHPLIQEIIKYNEIDCKVLQEILDYLRKNHASDIQRENKRKRTKK